MKRTLKFKTKPKKENEDVQDDELVDRVVEEVDEPAETTTVEQPNEESFDVELIGNRVRGVAADLPDSWQRLGVEFGYSPLDLDDARVVLLGLKKDGKSSLLASMENQLILDFEDAIGNIVGANSHRIRILNYKGLDAVREMLKTDALRNKRQFKRIGFDTIGRMQSLVKAKLSEQKKQDIDDYRGGRGGKDMVNQTIAKFLRDLYAWGYAWTAVFHWRWIVGQDDTGKGYQYLKAEAQPGAFEAITQDADYLMQIGSEWVAAEPSVVKGKKVFTDGKKVRRFILTTRDGEARGINDGLGTRVPLPEFLEVPKVNAWPTVVRGSWDEAVAEGRAEDARLRKE